MAITTPSKQATAVESLALHIIHTCLNEIDHLPHGSLLSAPYYEELRRQLFNPVNNRILCTNLYRQARNMAIQDCSLPVAADLLTNICASEIEIPALDILRQEEETLDHKDDFVSEFIEILKAALKDKEGGLYKSIRHCFEMPEFVDCIKGPGLERILKSVMMPPQTIRRDAFVRFLLQHSGRDYVLDSHTIRDVAQSLRKGAHLNAANDLEKLADNYLYSTLSSQHYAGR